MFTWADVSARGTFRRGAEGAASVFIGAFSAAPIRELYSDVTRTWCLSGDPVCDATFGNVNKGGQGIHTGVGYLSATEFVGHSALIDVLNTTLWALGRRDVPVPTPSDPPALIGQMRIEADFGRHRDCPRGFSGHVASVSWSAANLIGNRRAVFGYAWDLDNDGVFEETGPTAQHRYQGCFENGSRNVRWEGKLQVTGSHGLNELIPLSVTRALR